MVRLEGIRELHILNLLTLFLSFSGVCRTGLCHRQEITDYIKRSERLREGHHIRYARSGLYQSKACQPVIQWLLTETGAPHSAIDYR